MLDSVDPSAAGAVLEEGPDWAKWRSKSDPTLVVTGVLGGQTKGEVGALLATREGRPVVSLLADPGSGTYTFLQGMLAEPHGWQFKAWATHKDGALDRVCFRSLQGEGPCLADTRGRGAPNAIATRLEDGRWVVLVRDEGNTRFAAAMLYDPALGTYAAGGNYGTSAGEVRLVAKRLHSGGWMQQSLDTKGRLTATAILDDTMKILGGVLADSDSDGFADLFLIEDLHDGKLEPRPLKEPMSMDEQSARDLAKQLAAACGRAAEQWTTSQRAFQSFGALGHRLPRRFHLPGR